jgi:hypothetical protein
MVSLVTTPGGAGGGRGKIDHGHYESLIYEKVRLERVARFACTSPQYTLITGKEHR